MERRRKQRFVCGQVIAGCFALNGLQQNPKLLNQKTRKRVVHLSPLVLQQIKPCNRIMSEDMALDQILQIRISEDERNLERGGMEGPATGLTTRYAFRLK